jgi:hypothetical protein
MGQRDIAAANNASRNERMRLFAARKVQRLLLAFASALQAASLAENSNRTEGKLASPPILLGRWERGRRDARRLSTHKFVCKFAACCKPNVKQCKRAKSKR